MSTYNIALLVALYFVISMTACAGFALFHVELCQYASALLANVSELSSKYLIAVISSVAMIANVYSCFCKSQNAELAQASKMVSATPVKRQSTRRASSNTPKSTFNTNSSSNSNATPMIVVEDSSNINTASSAVEAVSENSPSVLSSATPSSILSSEPWMRDGQLDLTFDVVDQTIDPLSTSTLFWTSSMGGFENARKIRSY